MRNSTELPAEFYRQRATISDRLAACILLDPSTAPSREELPREIVADDNLRRMLALAAISSNSEQIVAYAHAELGTRYVYHLATIASDQRTPGAAFVWLATWYAAQLQHLEKQSQRHANAIATALRIAQAATREPVPKAKVRAEQTQQNVGFLR